MPKIAYSTLLLIILVMSLATNWYGLLSISLLLVILLMILQKIGRGIVLLEVTAFLYVFTCVVMPLAGYEYYSVENPLSKLWVKYMMVPKNTYFSYALPASTCFCLAITWPSFKNHLPDEGVTLSNNIIAIKKLLQKNRNA